MRLKLEGHSDLQTASPKQVARAVAALASPTGPTFIIVRNSEGSYCQAAGTDGRYVLEAREAFGEGFLHYRACVTGAGSGEMTKVYHRKRCDRHPPRRCPITVLSSEVVGLDDVQRALVAFAETGERCRETVWRNVNSEFTGEESTGEIRVIRPTAPRERRSE
jgi:hypothetical protein